MSNVQRCFVNKKSLIGELESDDLENNDENLFNEIIDNKCDDEIITHVFSQFKEKHVIDEFFCYDILIFDEKDFEFVRH